MTRQSDDDRPAGTRGRRIPTLSSRLSCIVDLVPASACVYDIGCDHALASIVLALRGRCERAFAVDRRAGPLATAADRIRRHGVGNRVMPMLADGLDGMNPDPEDTVIIAGMGGNEIARILERRPTPARGTAFVLQPMKSTAELRRWLSSAGFAIESERLCQDGRHIYAVLLARLTDGPGPVTLTPEEAWAGPCILRDRPPLFEEYLAGLLVRLRKAARTDPTLADVARNLAEYVKKRGMAP